MIYYMEDPLMKQCIICLDDFKEDEICLTNCNHVYCNECLTRWFEENKVECPFCRSEIKNYFFNDSLNNIVKIKINDHNVNNRINLYQQNIIRLYNQNVFLKMILLIQFIYSLYNVFSYSNIRNEIIEYQELYENCTNENKILENEYKILEDENNDIIEYLQDIKLFDIIKNYGEDYLKTCFLPIKYINHCTN